MPYRTDIPTVLTRVTGMGVRTLMVGCNNPLFITESADCILKAHANIPSADSLIVIKEYSTSASALKVTFEVHANGVKGLWTQSLNLEAPAGVPMEAWIEAVATRDNVCPSAMMNIYNPRLPSASFSFRVRSKSGLRTRAVARLETHRHTGYTGDLPTLSTITVPIIIQKIAEVKGTDAAQIDDAMRQSVTDKYKKVQKGTEDYIVKQRAKRAKKQ